MRYSGWCVLLLGIGNSIAVAVEPPKGAESTVLPSTLTPREIEDGWLMLFDGESTFGWKVEGEAVVMDGKLVVGGTKETRITTTAAFPRSALRWSFNTLNGSPATGGSIRGSGGQTVVNFKGLATQSAATPLIEEGLVKALGPIVVEVPAGQQIALSTLALRPEGLKPIFNGKDLSGWKVFEGDAKKNKSKFEVTPAGELHVINGPGDLQTTGQYADFLLQFDCKTNGKFLNSGIFFRCLPDQYQNGYEAQIQNAYLGTRTNPTDYGTGAIYRRVKARKVVSNDNEWFTMTVLAQGNHIATWVNGYPTVDWTDDRPADDNPRKGSKTGKGHLSIQGHDPTTDILFRNIRIEELPTIKKAGQ